MHACLRAGSRPGRFAARPDPAPSAPRSVTVKRPCLECGTPTEGSRCPAHRLPKRRSPSALAARKHPERARRKAVVDAWIAEHGYVCPGWKIPAHPSTDLTADHVVPVSKGGLGGPMTTLCRSCNGRKSATR